MRFLRIAWHPGWISQYSLHVVKGLMARSSPAIPVKSETAFMCNRQYTFMCAF